VELNIPTQAAHRDLLIVTLMFGPPSATHSPGSTALSHSAGGIDPP
jgi:hypothetical protein